MQAVVIEKSGGPEVLKVMNRQVPEPGRGEVRVDVKCTAVNRADLIQRQGFYPAPPGAPQDIPGLEYAGVVAEVGCSVQDLKVGDRVFGLTAGGSYAESVVVHSGTVAPIPDRLTFEEAAAIPEAYTTAYDAMVCQGGLSAGESVLIHAVGSGVGTAALQIADAIGANAVGTTRNEEKLRQARELGLNCGVVAKEGRFAEAVLEHFPHGVNVVLELVGGDYVSEDLDCIATRGRIILVGLLAGRSVDLDLGKVLRKRACIQGTTLRARPLEEKILAGKVLAENIVPLLESGKLRPSIDQVFPLKDAAEAHRYLESNESFGKVILKVGE